MVYYSSVIGENVIAAAKDQGFALPKKPKHTPELPEDLSSLDDESLMGLMNEFTAWADYAEAQVGLAVIAEREAEMEMDKTTAEVWRNTLDAEPKMSVTVLKTVALSETSVAKARAEYEDSYAYRRLVSDIAARYERDAQILSRELTRRTAGEYSARQRRRSRWEQ